MRKYLFLALTFVIICLVYAQTEAIYPMKDGAEINQYHTENKFDSKVLHDPDTSLYPNLPEVLVTEAGNNVESITDWENIRRNETLAFFTDEMYGRSPKQGEYTVNSLVVSTTSIADGTAVRKVIKTSITGSNGTHTFHWPLYLPNSSEPVPVVVLINHRKPLTETASTSGFFPLNNLILPRGYAVAVLNDDEVAADNNETYHEGIISAFNKNGPNDWKTIAAWAFGASRMIDYLVTNPNINPSKICVIGHSRGGKASLWTGAQDQRVALTMVNNSGCTGDALARSNRGETIQKINTNFPRWFPDSYSAYNGKDTIIPYDQHQLIALITPRLIATGVAAYDGGADPTGQFHSLVFAQPAFALYGKTDTTWEVNDVPDRTTGKSVVMRNGNLQHHLRNGATRNDGKHDLRLLDWENYLDFADLKL